MLYDDVQNTRSVKVQTDVNQYAITVYKNDALGRVIEIVESHASDPNSTGPTTNIFYDDVGNETRRLSPTVGGWRFETVTLYDARNRKATQILPDPITGQTVTVTSGNLTIQGVDTTWAYDEVGTVQSVTDDLGRTTNFEYDKLNRLVKELLPNPNQEPNSGGEIETGRPTTEYVYDAVGNRTEMIDARGSHTAFVYDIWNRQTDVYLPNPETGEASGPHTASKYDLVGNLVEFTDARGAITYYQYDKLNRMRFQLSPDADSGTSASTSADRPKTQRFYDDVGNVTKIIDAGGATTEFEYDKLNREVAVIQANPATGAATGLRTKYRYDLAGRRTQVRAGETKNVVNGVEQDDAGARVTAYGYDRLNRVTSVTLPNPESTSGDALITRMVYDDLGNVVSEMVEIPNGTGEVDRTTVYKYDRLNRRTKVYLPKPDGTNAGQATDGNGDPIGPHTHSTFDTLGNLETFTDARGAVTGYDYDRLNRKQFVTLPDADVPTLPGAITEWQYDIAGNVTEIIDPRDAHTAFEYDRLNRQTATVQADPDSGSAEGLRTEVVYDAVGNRTQVLIGRSEFDTDKRVTDYQYDFLNRVTDVYLPAPDADDLDVRLHTHNTYDKMGNLLTETVDVPNAGGDVDRTATYTYDKLNRRTAVILPRRSDGLSQDSATPSQVIGDKTKYEYDLFGNLEFVTDARSGKSQYTYDRLNRKRTETLPTPNTPNQANGPKTEWKYDLIGNVIEIISPFYGTDYRHTEFKFDALNRQWAVIEPNKTNGQATGLRTEYTYDANGNQKTVTIGVGTSDPRVTNYGYDFLNRVTDVELPKAKTTDTLRPHTEYDYDVNGNVTLQIEHAADGSVDRRMAFEYDLLNRKTFDRLPNSDTGSELTGESVETVYDVFGNVSAVVQRSEAGGSLVRVTTTAFDRLNRPVQETRPSPDGFTPRATTSWQYDVVGNVVLEIGVRQQQTKTQYDARNQVWKVFQPDPDEVLTNVSDPSMTYSYDESGNLLSQVDAAGHQTAFKYDLLNRQIDHIAPKLSGENEGLALVGSTIVGLRTHTMYDDAGNVRFVFDPVNIQGLDVDSLTIANMRDATKRKATETKYDYLNRVTESTEPDPDGTSEELAPRTTYVYDTFGNLESETQRRTSTLNEATSYLYDRLNRKKTVTDPNLEVTEYEYYLNGNLKSVEDAEGNITTFQYDQQDRVTEETIVLNSVEKTRFSDYDADGRLEQFTDRKGRVTQFRYDDLDRVISERWLDEDGFFVNVVTTTYNADGQVLRMSDASSSRTYGYDLRGRLTSDSNAGTPNAPVVEFGYEYYEVGNVWTRTQTIDGVAGPTDTYLYYATDWLKQQDQSGGGLTAKRVEYTYNNLGQYATIIRSVIPSGGSAQVVATSTYAYDSAHRLTDLVHTKGETELATYHYNYDGASRIEWQSSSADGTETFSFDDAGQLETAERTGTANNESYNYDGTGNRTGTGYATDSYNRITSSPNGSDEFDYTYDAEGNRTGRDSTNSADEDVEYQWDHRNRLTAVIFRDSSGLVTRSVVYAYDTNDLRIAKFVDTDGDGDTDKSEWFVNDGQQVEFSHFQDAPPPVGPTYSVTHHYLHGPDVDQVFADETSQGTLLWALTDMNGSVRDVATHHTGNDTTSLASHRVFNSFGVPQAPITDGFAYGYTGREYDAQTGLQYNRARWYDSEVGRFVSEDPLGLAAGDVNLSRYVFNDPTSNTDPSGNSWLSSLWKKVTKSVKNVFEDVGNFFEDSWGTIEANLQDAGDFVEEQWDNGNLQKALLAFSVVATGGAAAPFLTGAAGGLMTGGLAGAWTGFVGAGTASGFVTGAGAFSAISTTLGAASSAVNGPVRNLVSVAGSG